MYSYLPSITSKNICFPAFIVFTVVFIYLWFIMCLLWFIMCSLTQQVMPLKTITLEHHKTKSCQYFSELSRGNECKCVESAIFIQKFHSYGFDFFFLMLGKIKMLSLHLKTVLPNVAVIFQCGVACIGLWKFWQNLPNQ